MTIGSRLRGRGPRGLSRFLGEHQHCGSGFDVGRHDGAGSGKLTVTCAGCGERFLYEGSLGAAIPVGSALPASAVDPVAGVAAEDRPVEAERTPRRGGRGDWYWEGSSPVTQRARPRSLGRLAPEPTDEKPAPDALATESPVEAHRKVGGEPPTDRPGLRPSMNGAGGRLRFGLPHWWVDGLIVAAMLGAVAIIVLGAISNEDGPGDEAGAPAPTQAEQPAAPQPGGEDQLDSSAEAGATAQPDVELGRQREFLSRYAVSLPRGWDSDRDGAVVHFTSNDDDAGIRIFYERRSGSLESMEGEMSSFLKREHLNAEIGDPQSGRIGGHNAVWLRSTYRGGEQTATLIAASPFTYFVVTSLHESASSTRRAEAEALVNSFRPA